MKMYKLLIKKRPRVWTLLLGVILSFNLLNAVAAESIEQQAGDRTIKGTVIDAETQEPLIGVTVWVKDTSIGTITNIDGEYTVKVPNVNNVLVFSFIGFDTKEVMIGGKTEINVSMSEATDSVLDEVVVVGYGTQKRESVIGAISSLDVTNLKTPASKVSNMLAGQLAGVVSMNRSGEPGAGSDFYIRGISTFGSNKNPLVLVDGIERSIDLVDPEDIETFSVLKDATATAVYGVRGANGVLLITTRKGKEGKPAIYVRGELGKITPVKMPKYANAVQWAEMYNEAYRAANNGMNFYSDEALQKYKDGSDPDLYPNVNWMKALYKTWTSSQRANVNVSGGGTMVRYFVSGGLYNEGSIFKEEKKATGYDSELKFNRVNFRTNLDINLTTSTILNVNIANVYEKKNSPGELGNIWGYASSTSPNYFPVKYSDGKVSGPNYGTGYNPYNLLVYSGYQEQYWNNAQALAGLKQELDMITQGLKAEIKFSWDQMNYNYIKRDYTPMQYLATGRDPETGEVLYTVTHQGQESLGYNKGSNGARTTYFEGSLHYDHIFNDVHNVGALFLYNQKQTNNVGVGTAIETLPYKTQGLAARVTYAFKDRYFAEANMGYNGSENFAPGHRFGFFPAAAVGWLISSEPFWENLRREVDVLKVRVSHGKVGNDQIGGGRRFIYQATINSSDGYTFNNNGNGGIPTGGLQVGEIPNPNVGWETSTKTDAGLEIAFRRSLRLQADFFYEDRKGIFMQRQSLPDYAGISTMPWVNIGRMKNQGFDFSLEYDKKVGEVTINSRGTFTFTHNKIVENDEVNYPDKYRNKIGHRYGQYFGYQSLGFFQSYDEIANSPAQFGPLQPGDVKYKDINGDGVITEADQIAIGYSATPEILYGFGSTFQWRNLDFSFFFQGTGRVSILVTPGATSFKPFSSGNMGRSAINEDVYKHRWTPENPYNAKYPRLQLTGSVNNNLTSTQWLHDGSFLRLKTTEIGYRLPKSLIEKSFLGSVRFYVTGINLLTLSKFKLWDPEQGSGTGASYPPNKTVTFGVTVNI